MGITSKADCHDDQSDDDDRMPFDPVDQSSTRQGPQQVPEGKHDQDVADIPRFGYLFVRPGEEWRVP